jgi:hypothetical protein
MVFQPFLDQGQQRPVRGRAYLISVGLHGVLALLIWWAWRSDEGRDPPAARALATVAVSLRQPSSWRVAAPLAPGASMATAEQPRAARSSPSTSRHTPARPRRTPLVAASPAPPADAALAAKRESDLEPGALDRDADLGAPLPGEPGTPDGTADQSGLVASRPGRRRRPLELSGRVVGGGDREVMRPEGLPYAPREESTELRTYDVFPPLPAAQWTSDRPYLIVLDVCVSGEGQVSDVTLVRPASRTLDPVVLEAVRTWRYKPRLVDGHAQAFCHVVAIKYEQL